MAIFRPQEQISWSEYHLTQARRSLFRDTEWGRLHIRLYTQMRATMLLKYRPKICALTTPTPETQNNDR